MKYGYFVAFEKVSHLRELYHVKTILINLFLRLLSLNL